MPRPLALLRSHTEHARLALTPPAGADPVALIDRELAQLFAAREVFRVAALDPTNDMSPAQILRAWSDSTTRVLSLLRARREFAGDGDLGGILEQVYDLLETDPPPSP